MYDGLDRASTVVYVARMQTRRAQKPITIRSDRAADRLALLTRDGRSQAKVIEEALDRMPVPQRQLPLSDRENARMARINLLIDRLATADIPSMGEFDAMEYDEFGDPR